MRLLIVDDERSLVKGLSHFLTQEGYEVMCAYDGYEALKVFRNTAFDFIILDLMLPGIDGIALCKEFRKTSDIPIIMLTAKDSDIDKIVGLELGADDYMTKPFNSRELLARMKSILRRLHPIDKTISPVLTIGCLTIDPLGHRVLKRKEELSLTSKEYELLKLLASNKGRVYTRENLLELIWDPAYYGDLRTVDVHIRRLREKIEDEPANPKFLLTKWGIGYFFKGDEDENRD